MRRALSAGVSSRDRALQGTENAVVVDGRLTKISDELRWDDAADDWMAPWRISGGPVALTFHPEHLRRSMTQLGVIASRTHRWFGTWTGRAGDVVVDGIFGWAEDVSQRW